MLTALAIFIVGTQTKPKIAVVPGSSGPKIGPTVSAGSDPDFQALVLTIEEALAAKRFADAEKLVSGLPKRSIKFKIDYTGVPAATRTLIEGAMTDAQKAWSRMADRVTWVRSSQDPDFVVRFSPVLNVDAETGIPAGGAFFIGRTAPRAEVVVGLQRGKPLAKATSQAIRNEIAYGMARYFGLAPSPLFGTLASRTDLAVEGVTVAVLHEFGFAGANLATADQLRDLVQKKVSVIPAKPNAFLDPDSGSAGSVRESLPAPFTFQLTNRGNAPLAYKMVGDCGCVRTGLPGVVKPGATVLLKPYIDTTDFAGELHKRVILYTNDPEMSVRPLPISVNVLPSYRFLAPDGRVTLLGESDDTKIVYLSIPKGSPLTAVSARLDGVPASVFLEPWSGSLPDPERHEGSAPREGYKLTVKYEEPYPTSRAEATLVVTTGDKKKPRLRFPLSVQRGIVALPEEVYMGTLGQDALQTSFLVSRPGKPFKALEVTTNHSSLVARLETLPNGDAKVILRYDGKAPAGDFSAVVTVLTDDLHQPNIKVPVHGLVQ
jgi:Protein of unknown function (DUF1573)